MDAAENIRTDDELLESEDSVNFPDTGVVNSDVSNIPDAALYLVAALQATIELPQLIEIFSVEISRLLDQASLEYRPADDTSPISIGYASTHTCSYQLQIEGSSVGQLILTRHKPFAPNELSALELMLAGLVYPLRNALNYEKAKQDAHKDFLTDAYNRAGMDDAMKREISTARRFNRPLSAIMIDLDHFKFVNDTCGHSIGDKVLKTVADCIFGEIRDTDILCRYGGEEFTVILSDTDLYGAMLLAERIRRSVSAVEILVGPNEYARITISAGIATLEQGDDAISFVDRADQAMYHAKTDGRNRVRVTQDMELEQVTAFIA